MNAREVIDFVRGNPVCIFAAMEGKQPRRRAFLSLLFDDGKPNFTAVATNSVSGQSSDMQ